VHQVLWISADTGSTANRWTLMFVRLSAAHCGGRSPPWFLQPGAVDVNRPSAQQSAGRFDIIPPLMTLPFSEVRRSAALRSHTSVLDRRDGKAVGSPFNISHSRISRRRFHQL
jgi:hypothetical protein